MGQRGRFSRRRVGSVAVLCVALVGLLSLIGSSALGQTVRAGNLIVTVEGGFTPHRLPKKTPAGITLSARSTIRTADKTHLPALEELDLFFDKHTGVHTTGLPTCDIAKLQNTVPAQALHVCGDALVGKGKAGAEIAFPEQEPFLAQAPLLIFNGQPKDGHPVLIFHAYAYVPAPTTFVTTAVLSRASGIYGTQVQIQIPTIVAGQGSLNFAELSIHKTWMENGKKQNLLYGTCPTGHFYVRGSLDFSGGTTLAGKVVRSCSPSD